MGRDSQMSRLRHKSVRGHAARAGRLSKVRTTLREAGAAQSSALGARRARCHRHVPRERLLNGFVGFRPKSLPDLYDYWRKN